MSARGGIRDELWLDERNLEDICSRGPVVGEWLSQAGIGEFSSRSALKMKAPTFERCPARR